jgi:hypothetical protein
MELDIGDKRDLENVQFFSSITDIFTSVFILKKACVWERQSAYAKLSGKTCFLGQTPLHHLGARGAGD